MNRVIIPAALASIVLIAAVFALMPIEKASTVHATAAGQGIVTLTKSDTDFDANDNLDVTCDSDFVVLSMIVDVSNFAAADNVDLVVDPDGTGGDSSVIILDDIDTTFADQSLLGGNGVGNLGAEADGFVRLNFETENDTDGDGDDGESVTAHYVIRTAGSCS